MKDKFNSLLNELIKNKKNNNSYCSPELYQNLIREVSEAKLKRGQKTAQDYRRLQRYDIINVGNETKLISPVTTSGQIKYFVSTNEIFDIIDNAHHSIGHGGRNRLIKELNVKYKNITIESIMLYLSLCIACQQKCKKIRKGLVVKPIIASELNSRCQVDLIDLQTQPDDGFNFILNYQDHLTKFVILKPLKTKKATEVAEHLFDIFTLMGAPSILQSDNGREFCNKIIIKLTELWDGLKIVHGKPRHSQSQGSVERANQDVQNMLATWMFTNKRTDWSRGLKIIQMMKNRAYHSGINQTPYEAMFGTKMKLGLKTANLPDSVIKDINSEEELINVIEHTETIHETVLIRSVEEPSEQPEEQFESPTEKPVLLAEKQNLITNKRLIAKESLQAQANKMLSHSNLKYIPASVGDIVKVPIPEFDRGKTDSKNLLCIILSIDNINQLYKLGTNEGILKQLYTRNEFDICREKLMEINVPDAEISVREAVRKQSLMGGQGFKKCNCKQNCNSNKCQCKAFGVLCNSKCHNSIPCKNKG